MILSAATSARTEGSPGGRGDGVLASLDLLGDAVPLGLAVVAIEILSPSKWPEEPEQPLTGLPGHDCPKGVLWP